VQVERPLVIPGERVDLVWEPRGAPGAEIPLRWVAYDRGFGTAYMRPEEVVVRIRVSDLPAQTDPPLPAAAPSIQPLDLSAATQISLKLTRNDVDKQLHLGINGKAFDEHVHARVGETQVWTVENTIDWDHPFHIHGFSYQVLDDDGVPVQPLIVPEYRWHVVFTRNYGGQASARFSTLALGKRLVFLHLLTFPAEPNPTAPGPRLPGPAQPIPQPGTPVGLKEPGPA
jgi:FtsP/CotA-like multicopper oxidase with cupredoxin domain